MRLIVRPDFDGIVCGALLTAKEPVDRFLFVEPKAMQDREIAVAVDDIIANLPCGGGCALWFDHHAANRLAQPVPGSYRIAPSAARVVFEYYRWDNPQAYEEMVAETDRIDSGSLGELDILQPQRYVLLAFTVDNHKADDAPYWLRLIRLLREQPLAATMADPEVKDRCRAVIEDFTSYGNHIEKFSRRHKNIIISDLRGKRFKGKENRFLVYCLFPDTNVALRLFDDPAHPGHTGISAGKNIFNKTLSIHLGELMVRFGGGGHEGAASCRVPDDAVERILPQIIEALTSP